MKEKIIYIKFKNGCYIVSGYIQKHCFAKSTENFNCLNNLVKSCCNSMHVVDKKGLKYFEEKQLKGDGINLPKENIYPIKFVKSSK